VLWRVVVIDDFVVLCKVFGVGFKGV